MRRLSWLLLAILTVGVATPAFAQTAGNSFGLTAGFGTGYGTVPETKTRKLEPTFNGGVVALMPLSENWAFQPELKYDHRKITTGGITTNIAYLSLPLLLRNKFHGVYMVQGITINTVMKASIFDVDFKKTISSPDVAVVIGAGKRVNRWSFDARFETGLRNLQKDVSLGGIRTRSITGVVTYFLK